MRCRSLLVSLYVFDEALFSVEENYCDHLVFERGELRQHPLVNPTAHGGKASAAFHVVIPSMPGYGFSGKPTTTGWS